MAKMPTVDVLFYSNTIGDTDTVHIFDLPGQIAMCGRPTDSGIGTSLNETTGKVCKACRHALQAFADDVNAFLAANP